MLLEIFASFSLLVASFFLLKRLFRVPSVTVPCSPFANKNETKASLVSRCDFECTVPLPRWQELDQHKLISMFSQAFAEDPSISSFLHPDQQEARRYLFFRITLPAWTTQHHLCFTTSNVFGAALWTKFSSDARRESLLTMLPRFLLSYAPCFGPSITNAVYAVNLLLLSFFQQTDKLLREHGKFYYLSFLAVDPSLRSCGLGSKLIQPGLQRCDSEGAGAFLISSNPRNVTFYQRHGFVIIDSKHFGLNSVTGREAIQTYMWRHPQPS